MSSSAVNQSTSSIFFKKITSIPFFENEILATIPSRGSGDGFSDRQLLLVLRLSLNERQRRASNIWGPKGRMLATRCDWYHHTITDNELWYVGLKKDTTGGIGELRNGEASKVRNLKVVDADWVANWKRGIPGGPIPLPPPPGAAGVAGPALGLALVEPCPGVNYLLHVLQTDRNLSLDAEGKLIVDVVWIHEMDGEIAKEHIEHTAHGAVCARQGMAKDLDIDEEDEDDHSAALHLDMTGLTGPKLLSQLDTAITVGFPHDDWKSFKLCDVEFGCRLVSLDFQNELRDSAGANLTLQQARDASVRLNIVQIHVGYEWVGEALAKDARRRWAQAL